MCLRVVSCFGMCNLVLVPSSAKLQGGGLKGDAALLGHRALQNYPLTPSCSSPVISLMRCFSNDNSPLKGNTNDIVI